nr:sigma-70 family RNA polymerase sigma factor [Nitrosomonas nitrosa]
MRKADLILREFLSSNGEDEQEKLLAELIQLYAVPIVRQTLWLRLGFRVSQSGANPHNADAEDVYQSALVKLLQQLREMQATPNHQVIKDFSHYVRRVTLNTCHDYLRGKAPARARLKDRLRDTLHRQPDFCLWKADDGRLLCGLARGQKFQGTSLSSQRLEEIREQVAGFNVAALHSGNSSHLSLPRILAEIFERAECPLELNQIVEIVADLAGNLEQPDEPLDDDKLNLSQHLASPPVQNLRLEGRERLARLWREVQQLPQHYRNVICLSFASEDGEDLLTVLTSTEIATFPEVATALEMSLEELLRLWPQLPMDNAMITAHLHTTKEQINKWRYRALQRLKRQVSAGKEK